MTADRLIEALKVLRSEWLTQERMCIEFELARPAVSRFVRAGMQHGMLKSRQSAKPEGKCGFAPAEFAVSQSWGGIA